MDPSNAPETYTQAKARFEIMARNAFASVERKSEHWLPNLTKRFGLKYVPELMLKTPHWVPSDGISEDEIDFTRKEPGKWALVGWSDESFFEGLLYGAAMGQLLEAERSKAVISRISVMSFIALSDHHAAVVVPGVARTTHVALVKCVAVAKPLREVSPEPRAGSPRAPIIKSQV